MADGPLATVLHIEDDEIERKLMAKAFERVDADLDLQQAPHADRAGDLLANRWLEPPLVILVDLMVPGMYGGDFLAALREDPILSGTPRLHPLGIGRSRADPERLRPPRRWLLREDRGARAGGPDRAVPR